MSTATQVSEARNTISKFSNFLRRTRVLRRVVCFVPFSLECFGAWGQEASAFFNMAASHVSNFRDVDHFHWSEASFRRYWATALSMTVARGQADVVCRHARNNPSFTTRGFALGDTPLGGPG